MTAGSRIFVGSRHGSSGIGFSRDAGLVVGVDATPEADNRLERILTSDPGISVVRHADAGYPEALRTAAHESLRLPKHEEAEC